MIISVGEPSIHQRLSVKLLLTSSRYGAGSRQNGILFALHSCMVLSGKPYHSFLVTIEH